MPNRILKESICSSESIERMSLFEEVVFYRLIVQCDDYGRMDARATVLRSKLFPLRESVSAMAVSQAVEKLALIGVLKLYSSGGRPYLYLSNWEKHQSIRIKRARFPPPSDQCQDESEQNRSSEQSQSVTFPLLHGESLTISENEIAHMSEIHSCVSVPFQLRRISKWLQAHPSSLRSAEEMQDFIEAWLQREKLRIFRKCSEEKTTRPPEPVPPDSRGVQKPPEPVPPSSRELHLLIRALENKANS